MEKGLKGLRDIAQRQMNAANEFCSMLAEQFSITEDDARRVFDVFRKVRALKFDAVGGRYTLTHGAFWEPDVIAKALGM
jgi:hypothetical protein